MLLWNRASFFWFELVEIPCPGMILELHPTRRPTIYLNFCPDVVMKNMFF